ncbi:hypothetical protein BC567DRAFT_219453 [Phyllosticta citribraziliensis]
MQTPTLKLTCLPVFTVPPASRKSPTSYSAIPPPRRSPSTSFALSALLPAGSFRQHPATALGFAHQDQHQYFS